MKRFLIPHNIHFDDSFALEFITKLLSCISCLSLSFCPMMLSLSFFLSLTYSVKRYSFSLSLFLSFKGSKMPSPISVFNLYRFTLFVYSHSSHNSRSESFFTLLRLHTPARSLSYILSLFLTFSLSFFHSLCCKTRMQSCAIELRQRFFRCSNCKRNPKFVSETRRNWLHKYLVSESQGAPWKFGQKHNKFARVGSTFLIRW